MRSAPRARLVGKLAVGLLGFGLLAESDCILFVHPATGGLDCAFTGESTRCGACIAQSCQPEVNGCCADGACGAGLDALDACATTHGQACVTLQAGGSGNTAEDRLASCVATQCRGECQPFTGTSTTVCTEPDFGKGSVCNCQLAAPGKAGNDFVCSSADYPGTLCCAPDGWPAEGQQCSCQALACNPTSDGCFCMLVDYAPDAGAGSTMSASSCAGQHCCVEADTCTCRSGSCMLFETEVPTCDVAHVACKSGQQKVPACSLFAGP